MSAYDWSKFKLRITIKADMASVYKLWTTRQGLEKWFLRQAEFRNSNQEVRHRTEFIHAGDEYEWLWHGYSDDVKENGKIECDEDDDAEDFCNGTGANCDSEDCKVDLNFVIDLASFSFPCSIK